MIGTRLHVFLLDTKMGNKTTLIQNNQSSLAPMQTSLDSGESLTPEKWSEFVHFHNNLTVACQSGNEIAQNHLPKPIYDIFRIMERDFSGENAIYRVVCSDIFPVTFILKYEKNPNEFNDDTLREFGYNILGSVFKYWLTCLVEPMCTSALYPLFCDCEIDPRILRVIIRKLPYYHFFFFKEFARHILVLSEKRNNMTVHNFALVFANFLFWDLTIDENEVVSDAIRVERSIKYKMRFTNILKDIVEEQLFVFADERDQYLKVRERSSDLSFSFV
jgi:hypothetical protein